MTSQIVRRALAFAALSLWAGAVSAAQTVPNSGFEEGTDKPTGWSTLTGEGGTGTFAWEQAAARTGARGFRAAHTNGVGYTLLASGLVVVKPGAEYVVSAWVRPETRVRRGVYFMVSQYRADGAVLDLPNTFSNTGEPLIAGQWQQLTVHVKVRAGNTRLCVQCVQAQAPTDVCWDDFAVAEAAALPPPRYEPSAQEPLPDLEAAKRIVARRKRAVVVVRQEGGQPRLFLDGKPTPWAFYVGPFWNPRDAQVADFRDAGVHVYLVPLVLGRDVYAGRGPWLGKGRYDFREVDDLLWRTLRVDPQGYILFYMGCDPYRDWGADNPDDVTQDQNGLKAIVDMHPKRWGGPPPATGERYGPCLVSQRLRDETSDTLRRLVAHVEASPAGKAVIGYHVAGSNDGQWFHWMSPDPANLHLADYCPAAVASFRAWLARRYGDAAALQRAWHLPEATFDTARVPPASRLWAAGALVDPATQQDIADYTRFYSEGVAETVMQLAATLKQATPRRILCGTYYEDITCNSANHVALGRYLASPALDYLAGPAAYSIRMPGYPGAVRSVFASMLLHGKTFLTEEDWRSWHSAPDNPEENFAWGRAETPAAHNAMVRRECGMMAAFGLGTWWYDMSGGWFHDKAIMSAIAEAVRAFRMGLNDKELPYADLAVVVSEESNDYVMPAASYLYRYAGVQAQIEELNTAGVPYRLYLQSDLSRKGLPPHKAWIFLNPYRISPAERAAIERLKRDGRLLVFVHAPGVVGAADPAAAVSAVTGIRVRSSGASAALASEPVAGRALSWVPAGCIPNVPTGLFGPTFEVVDPTATPLARYLGADRVAAAARDFGKWKSVFVGCPGLSAEFVSALAGWAGCWRAADPGDAVYANDHYVTIHALFPGPKHLRLHRPSRVMDLSSGAVISAGAAHIDLTMDRGETRWFRLEAGRRMKGDRVTR